MLRQFAIAAALGCAVPAALADAIPPPAEINALQKLLIGTWHEDTCVMPQGLGHSCLQRIYVFGDESVSEVDLSDMSVSNMWSTSARTGKWSATNPDASTARVSVSFTGGPTTDLTLTMDATGFQLVSSEYAMFPASHFTRLGKPIVVSK